MSRKKTKQGFFDFKKLTAGIAAFIVLACSLLITYAGQLDLPFNVPTWKQIFSRAELTEITDYSEHPFTVHFIDVGQGDCSLIVSGEKTMLIDGGERENSTKILAYLQELGIERLDCIIATHPHSDHIGGLIGIIEKIGASEIIMPALSESNIPTTKVYGDLLNAIGKSGAVVYAAIPGDEYAYGDMDFTVLAPNSDNADLNNMSVVIRLEYMNKSFLFTGDAETSSEYAIMDKGFDVSADVLKVGHHGSKTSSGKAFIEMVNPEYAVISCGEGNSYGHPTGEILELFETMNINILRTDLNGNIVIAVDENGIKVNLQKGGA